jgi:MFS family permease
VGVLGITETTSWGILYYAFSVFVAPMEAELGWSRSLTTGAFSMAVLLSGLAAVPVGRWLDRRGPRMLMTAGSCAGVLLTLAWANVHDVVTYYVVWAAIGLTMATVLYDPAFAVVAVWFHRQRARALTALTLVAAFASTIFLPIAALLVELQGWRMALVSLALILGVITIPLHVLFLRRGPRDLGLYPDGDVSPPPTVSGSGRRALQPSEALRQPAFRWIALAFCLAALGSVGLPVHLVVYLAERGYDTALAATATGVIGALQVAGRLLFAPMEGRLAPRVVSVCILGGQAIAFIVLQLVPGSLGVWGFVVLLGASRGAATLLRPTLISGLFGAERFASIAGVLTMFVSVANAIAPVAVGVGYELFGGYEVVVWLIVAMSIAATVAIFFGDQRERI